MAVTIKEVTVAFDLLYKSLLKKDFSKSAKLHLWGESDLLLLVRAFLLGYFGHSVTPEAKAKLPGSLSGNGRIDFVIGDVAVEFAVRRPDQRKATLSAVTNSSEVKKLMKFNGKALLVLFDFSKAPFAEEDIKRYRQWPSLGKGPHRKSPFNVAYFHRGSGKSASPQVIKRRIRVRSRPE